ncbi:hypothetical protein M011DRAFT_467300 [Sporormia fimetaria CBS 119925]|uniref:MARVEL domain-containing protein n=1 Tax=Sporormia fimetaria CBS 119925 TaxID=1340428 RepID=A0A6A6VF01_9PLEO|nr:hypothetical protein M011DRAFT_467300 [Sporormia fimetaria CBS 119925]
MRIPQSYIQKCKVVAHGLQILFIFITACIAIAVMTKDGDTGGPTKFYFALCFLTIPALIYLVMVPMWQRAARFANAYAFITVDALYTLLWFAAFVAVAAWNSQGIKDGAKEKKLKDDDDRNCTTFKFGPEDKCELSKANAGIGAVIFVFFAITTGISTYYLIKFRKEGVMPYQAKEMDPHHTSGETHKDNAWSTEIGQHDPFDDDDRHTERGGRQEEDEYALLNSTETDDGRHPGRPLSWGEDRFERDGAGPPYGAYGTNPSELSATGYEQYRVQQPPSPPPAPYNSVGKGYQFQ